MGRVNVFYRIIMTASFFISANSFLLLRDNLRLIPAAIFLFLIPNIFCGLGGKDVRGARLKICSHGAWCLVIFAVSAVLSAVLQIIMLFYTLPNLKLTLLNLLFCFAAHFLLFWNGIISVYCTSVQLGIRRRVVGALCGLIPIANLFVLRNIIKVTLDEVSFEAEKDRINRSREHLRVCATRYPILLVHGVFFRDYKYVCYWGRIPAQLIKNGAQVYYGNHQSALSVADSAKELSARIREITDKSGCGKVNIIAHSKGGLDCRRALQDPETARRVASLTTINTPHRGCGFADYLLSEIPLSVQNRIAAAYNGAARRLGDTSPDFMAAVRDLTSAGCAQPDIQMQAPVGVYCQSVGSVLRRASHGKFPLNLSYRFVRHFDGANDGLVSVQSFEWGSKYILLQPSGARGISHGDVVDLNRENIPGFDVREFYVRLVSDLKARGL